VPNEFSGLPINMGDLRVPLLFYAHPVDTCKGEKVTTRDPFDRVFKFTLSTLPLNIHALTIIAFDPPVTGYTKLKS